MTALQKQRINLKLTEDDKNMIEEAVVMTNQSLSPFMVRSASERAAEVIDQHRYLILNEGGIMEPGHECNQYPAGTK